MTHKTQFSPSLPKRQKEITTTRCVMTHKTQFSPSLPKRQKEITTTRCVMTHKTQFSPSLLESLSLGERIFPCMGQEAGWAP